MTPRSSVHASGVPFRMSATVSTPAATAPSAQRRDAVWKAVRQAGPQNTRGEPPRRSRQARPHQRQGIAVPNGFTLAGLTSRASSRKFSV
jgi:hypothetical protein